MVIFKLCHRFEMTVADLDGEWRAALQEFVPGRLFPTQHLLRTFESRCAAIAALLRKWQLLFPEDPPLQWREPPSVTPSRRADTSQPPGSPRNATKGLQADDTGRRGDQDRRHGAR